MKTKLIFFTVMNILFITTSCNEVEIKHSPYSCKCDCNREAIVIKTLTNVKANVKFSELIEDFTIELSEEKLTNNYLLIPCDNSLPNKYKKNELAIMINAEVISCVGNTSPNIRMFPFYLIKITNVKKI